MKYKLYNFRHFEMFQGLNFKRLFIISKRDDVNEFLFPSLVYKKLSKWGLLLLLWRKFFILRVDPLWEGRQKLKEQSCCTREEPFVLRISFLLDREIIMLPKQCRNGNFCLKDIFLEKI